MNFLLGDTNRLLKGGSRSAAPSHAVHRAAQGTGTEPRRGHREGSVAVLQVAEVEVSDGGTARRLLGDQRKAAPADHPVAAGELPGTACEAGPGGLGVRDLLDEGRRPRLRVDAVAHRSWLAISIRLVVVHRQRPVAVEPRVVLSAEWRVAIGVPRD